MIRVHCFGFAFTPRLLPTLVLLIVLPILISLGIWQCHRAADKRERLAQFQTRNQTTLTLRDVNARSLKHLAYRSIRVSGHYDNAHPFLIDNKIMNRRVGYDVVSPFIPDNADKVVLVNRGWIAGTRHRDRLPFIAPRRGKQRIEGFIKLPLQNRFRLSNDKPIEQWPMRLQTINMHQLSTLYRKPLYPFVILLSPKLPGSFIRKWQPVVVRPEKHLAYAVQWFALALTLVIMYFVLNTRRERNDKARKAKTTL